MEARTKRIVIAVTPTEKAILKRLAEFEGRLSLTATVRHILMKAARQRGLVSEGKNMIEGMQHENRE